MGTKQNPRGASAVILLGLAVMRCGAVTGTPTFGDGANVDAAANRGEGGVAAPEAGSPGDASSDAATASDSGAPLVPRCLQGAPLPTGRGGYSCVVLGPAVSVPRAGNFPTVDARWTALGRVVYVDPTSTEMAPTGAVEHPFRALSEALADTVGAQVVVLASGTHMITGALAVNRGVLLTGAGAGAGVEPPENAATMLEFTPDATLTVSTSSGDVQLENVLLSDGRGAQMEGTALSALGVLRADSGGTLRLRDVRVRSAQRCAVRAVNAQLRIDGFASRDAPDTPLCMLDSDVTLKNAVVSSGHAMALWARGTSLSLSDSSFAGNSGGVVLLGATDGRRVDAVLNHVAISNEPLTGLQVRGAGLRVVAQLLGVFDTGYTSAAPSFGVVAAEQARLDLDPDLPLHGIERAGVGSIVQGNRGCGVLYDGSGTTGSLHGSVLRENGTMGMMAQNGARVDEVSTSRIERNGVAGVSATTGGLVLGFFCNTISDNFRAIANLGGATIEAGDGILIAQPTLLPDLVTVAGNNVMNNARFGGYFLRVRVNLMGNTSGGMGAASLSADTNVVLSDNAFSPARAEFGSAPGGMEAWNAPPRPSL